MRAIVLAGAFAASIQAQAVQTLPPRDTRPSPPASATPRTNNALIRGRVLAADTGKPLARATITALAPFPGGVHRAVISSNADGRYELLNLPAGTYQIAARHPGYLDLQYDLGFLDIPESAAVDLDFRLTRMSVIAGQVVDEFGDPIAGATVAALVWRYFSGGKRLESVSTATTDADGEYRLTRLRSGTYIIRGQYTDIWASGNNDGAPMGYARVHAPGALVPAEATPVSVGVGEEVTGISFALIAGPLATIMGTAHDATGAPLQSVTISAYEGPAARREVRSDGSFAIGAVHPGHYVLAAEGAGVRVGTSIEVSGASVAVPPLVLPPGHTLAGRVVTDPAAQTPLNRSRVEIRMIAPPPPSDRFDPMVLGTASRELARADSEGRFTMPAVYGRARLDVTLPPGWVLKSATANGRSLVGVDLDMPRLGPLRDVELVVTDRTGSLAGRAVHASGAPMTIGSIIVFSEDPAWWWTGGVREVKPNQHGEFRIDRVRAGTYAIAAVEHVENGMWFQPEYLRALLPRARRVAVGEDEHVQSVSLVAQ